jgi:hypothetical protein
MRFCLHLIGALMSKMKSYLSDAALLMDREFGYHDNVPDNYKEYRYEERYGSYTLRCWCDGREVSTKGEIDTRPLWLSEIVDLAKVGGHMARVNQPPPDCIVWFETDNNNKLQQFKDMERK